MINRKAFNAVRGPITKTLMSIREMQKQLDLIERVNDDNSNKDN